MNKFIVISIIKNEEQRFLREWLLNVQEYADLHVILDDGSTDNTAEIIKGFKNIVLRENKESIFKKNEQELRSQLWDLTKEVAKENDFILVVDADEFYDEELIKRKKELLELPDKYDLVSFKLCDMWDKKNYRIDGYWSPFFNRGFKFKDKPFCKISEDGLHRSPLPDYVLNSKNIFQSNIRCKHRSYETIEARKNKFAFYLSTIDPRKDLFNFNHAMSICQPAELKEYKPSEEYPEILIASLIRNREWLLNDFLKSFEEMDYPKDKVKYYFIVNNCTDGSEQYLCDWAKRTKNEIIIKKLCFEETQEFRSHTWDSSLLSNMAKMRNIHLAKAKELEVDYLISIDSDILFPKDVIKHLVSANKDVLCPVFYASWKKDGIEGQRLPQVWQRGGYDLSREFLNILQGTRALYQVGGLGAFTCISKKVFNNPFMSYDRVFNLPREMNGEDRDFCIRATCQNIGLWASTYYDLIHVDNFAYYDHLIKSGEIEKMRNG